MTRPPAIPGYQIVQLLGRGGMAAVYSARHLALGRDVAIKLVSAAAQSEPQRQRLELEARALAGLHHPNIVELYDFGVAEGGAMYYVMPLLPGGSLAHWAKPVDELQVLDLLHELLDALAHAHKAGIVHRDIKPENILFDRNGRPLLADFGAAIQRTRSRLTEEGLAIGSTGYMSPEQARALDVDARSDLYALAVVAWELLTGKLPFDGPDALAVALAQVEQPLGRLPRGLRHWQGFFERALQVDPARRYADAADMRAALDRVQNREPERGAGTRGRGLLLAVAAVVLLIGLFAWLASGDSEDAQENAQLAAIGQLIETGALAAPAQPNALDRLLADDAAALGLSAQKHLRELWLQRMAATMMPALSHDDFAALETPWRHWQAGVVAFSAKQWPAVREFETEAELHVKLALEAALAQRDPAQADAALDFVDAWALAPKDALELAVRVRNLPVAGERFSDALGGEWVIARAPTPTRSGLAVAARAVTPAEFARFRSPSPDCANAPRGVQGCIDIELATGYAQWLSGRLGQTLRVPSRAELAGAVGQIAAAPARAITSNCREQQISVKPNIAKRAFGNVRSWFGGKKAEARVETRCTGQYAIALDSGAGVSVLADAASDATLVLVRDLPRTRD